MKGKNAWKNAVLTWLFVHLVRKFLILPYFCSIKIQWHFFRFLSIVIIHFCDLKLATKTINWEQTRSTTAKCQINGSKIKVEPRPPKFLGVSRVVKFVTQLFLIVAWHAKFKCSVKKSRLNDYSNPFSVFCFVSKKVFNFLFFMLARKFSKRFPLSSQ